MFAVDSDHFKSLFQRVGWTELFIFKMPCSVEFFLQEVRGSPEKDSAAKDMP